MLSHTTTVSGFPYLSIALLKNFTPAIIMFLTIEQTMNPILPYFLGSKKDVKVVKMACKKVYFLTVWAVQNVEDLQCLARLVDIEHGKLLVMSVFVLISEYACSIQGQAERAGNLSVPIFTLVTLLSLN